MIETMIPRDRLQLMLDLTSEMLPGTEVYKLYDCILSTCADPKRAYLHLSVVAALANPLPISEISKLLGPGQGSDVETALVQLRSVIDIPTDSSLPVNIYHSSVRDYVSNPSNCNVPQVQYIMSPHSLLARSSLRLMMQDIPESTALLDALLELKRQSQAMLPDNPQRLKDSLSFIVQPLEPLRVIICLLWLRGDSASDLQSWLETPDGRAYLQTHEGKDWLQNQGGKTWLPTLSGKIWLRTQEGEFWLQTQGGKDWLQTQSGRHWLQTQSGKDWLQTREGEDWLQTHGVKDWLWTQSGQDWLQTRSGQDWLWIKRCYRGLDNGLGWLQTVEGRHWLENEDGRDWLQTCSGRDWLQTEDRRYWSSECVRQWLKTLRLDWLDTYFRPDCAGQLDNTSCFLLMALIGITLRPMDVRSWWLQVVISHWVVIITMQPLILFGDPLYPLLTRSDLLLCMQSFVMIFLLQLSIYFRNPLAVSRLQPLQIMISLFMLLLLPLGLSQLLLAIWVHNLLRTVSGRERLQTRRKRDWLLTSGGRDLLKGREWLQTQSGRGMLQTQGGRDWLETRSGKDWLETKGGREWLQAQRGRDWLQTQGGREWLQTQIGGKWLQTQIGRDWLQTQSGQDWLQMPHGREWQSTLAASVWVTMEEFSSTLEAITEYPIIPELPSLPAFQVIMEFKSLPDFLMFPAFLALWHQDFSTSPLPRGHSPPDMEIIHAMKVFESFANETRERSRLTSDALKYACQNWAVHLSQAPTPWDDTLNHTFKSFWNRHLLSWLERQWCSKDLRSCLAILSKAEKLAKEHALQAPGSSQSRI
ncbi:hypothetical protein DFH29DRAFT_133405 [Suillus ampliporus]|nr:hypothetical protein DFH29DRAFT_133405 [Suillus ampliporus]